MKNLKNKIKKKYSYLRKSYIKSEEEPKRLTIKKAKWFNNADSPVMLMIDDLANAWHSKSGSSTWCFGGDWGGGLFRKDSVMSFLNNNLLGHYPEVKVTFFAVAGKTSKYTYSGPFSFSEPLNFNNDSKMFFRELNENDRFEIAYHGYNHGSPGKNTEDFVQEWRGFKSIDDAIKQIEMGKEIFRDVFGGYPTGGKYGGWDYNEFADETVDSTGFSWWCRDWMPRDTKGTICDSYYEPQFFGKNFVVAIPSTVHGFYWNKKQINKLLENKQIISIEEHIAPVRPDSLVQAPNIIDDIDELRNLFTYLKSKNIWYATGTEVANYFVSYAQSIIYDIKLNSFKVRYLGKVKDPVLTLNIDCSVICKQPCACIKVILPDGNTLAPENIKYDEINCKHVVNIPISDGEYLVETIDMPLT